MERGATIYGELIGYGASDDAYHMAQPIEDGSGAVAAMRAAAANTPYALSTSSRVETSFFQANNDAINPR